MRLKYVRRILRALLLLGYATAFWGTWEFATTLNEHGLIPSPIWSGALGAPIPHHYIIGFICVGVGVIGIEWTRRNECKNN